MGYGNPGSQGLSNRTEDRLNKEQIRKQVRAALIETTVMVYNKDKYETAKLRGQLALELNSNFRCNYKLFFLDLFSNNWEDKNYIHSNIKPCVSAIPSSNSNTSTNNNKDKKFSYKIVCQNLQGNLGLIDYNVNMKMYNPLSSFSFNTKFQDNKYKLELAVLNNSSLRDKVSKAEMIVKIILKNSAEGQFKILKSSISEYEVEGLKISYQLTNFTQKEKLLIGILFETPEKDLIEVVKVSYRYLNEIPSKTDAEVFYLDEEKRRVDIDTVKKSTVEISFIP
mmetsp:Transcript_27183/g.28246  ORF Transcript_27183/g.28246 Transcript_27183/m.28246 type:complete len:281 (+) Transcript_27183:3-845(+)